MPKRDIEDADCANAKRARPDANGEVWTADPTSTATTGMADEHYVMPDVALPAEPTLVQPPAEGWCEVSAGIEVTDQEACAAVRLHFFDDDDDGEVVVPTDFVIMADVSQSMDQDDKLEQLKLSLREMVCHLNQHDRVALIEFDHEAAQITALKSVAVPRDRLGFLRAVEGLEALGGTDISNAMFVAGAVARLRKHPNPLLHILLLTDGRDVAADRAPKLPPTTTLSCFGYGDDHDARLLQELARHGQGSYTYIRESGDLEEHLAAFVTDSVAHVARNVRVRFKPAPGVDIVSVEGPGQAYPPTADGTKSMVLQLAPVDGSREWLVRCTGTPSSEGPLFTVAVTAERIGSAAELAVPPLEVRPDGGATVERVHAAKNRLLLVEAAHAVAQLLASGSEADATDITDSYADKLVGELASEAREELDELATQDEAYARSTASALAAQSSLRVRPRMIYQGKGARKGWSVQMARKSRRL